MDKQVKEACDYFANTDAVSTPVMHGKVLASAAAADPTSKAGDVRNAWLEEAAKSIDQIDDGEAPEYRACQEHIRALKTATPSPIKAEPTTCGIDVIALQQELQIRGWHYEGTRTAEATLLSAIAFAAPSLPPQGEAQAIQSDKSIPALFASLEETIIGGSPELKEQVILAARSLLASAVPEGDADEPFCWWRLERDITDEYSAQYSEDGMKPKGSDWKPLFDRPAAIAPQGGEVKAVAHVKFRDGVLVIDEDCISEGPGDVYDPREEWRPVYLAQTLPVANTASAEKLRVAVNALRFYADGDHFELADPDAWDTVSGEPVNFQCDEAGTATVEVGLLAKMALEEIAGENTAYSEMMRRVAEENTPDAALQQTQGSGA